MSTNSQSVAGFGCIADRVSLILFSVCPDGTGFEHDPFFSRCSSFELACRFQYIPSDGAIGFEPVLSMAGIQGRPMRRKALSGAATFAGAGSARRKFLRWRNA
jgi:hypothetical protein